MAVSGVGTAALAADPWVVYEGREGPGNGKHIVFVTGDEEYRSEEGMPMLAKILSARHGFKCTVLFPINPEDGTIDPNNQTNVPGLHLLEDADLMVLFARFREFPDEDMKHFVDYLNGGGPIIAFRTSTHAFEYRRNPESPYARYDWRNREWPGGFGRQVLGDTWINHHGRHGQEGARGLINGLYESHPVLRGVKDIWGPSDVYGIRNLTPDARVLVHGLTLKGMEPDSPPNFEKSLMPLVWVKNYQTETGNTARILTSTIGASVDLESEDLRRLVVNGCYWAVGLAGQIPERADVNYVGEYKPTFFGFDKFTQGVKPSDHEL
ncbi:MAG TPA: hypothetical protein VMS21_07510 [Methylomirabilota bacterium]|nr:hypothetical protein [Methylomirabilota bacterium]